MAIKQSSQPTIKEAINPVKSPQAAVRAQNSYTAKRPDHVTMNSSGTDSWAYLAKSLGQFDASFSKYAERKTQEYIDEAVAKGQLLFENNKAEGRNQHDWKSFIESHPEYAGANPHLKKGYEQARLRSLGLEATKAYNDAFTTSGLQNEEDQEVIAKWSQDFWINYREANGLTGYDNPVALAKEFSPFEAKAKQSVMQSHSESLRAQQENKTKMAFANLAVTEVNQTLDPTIGGLDIEDELSGGRQVVMGIIERNIAEALSNGVLNINGPDMAWDIIENLYLTSDNENFLEIAKTMEIGGIKLYSLPKVVKSVERYEAQLAEQQRVEAAAYQKNLELQKKQAKEDMIVSVLEWHEQNPDNILTSSTLYELGVPLLYHSDALKAYNAIQNETDKAMKTSKAYRVGFADAYLESVEGRLTKEQAIELYNLTGDEIFLTNFQKGEDKQRKQEMLYWSQNNLDTPPTAETLKELGYPEEYLTEFVENHNKTVKAYQASREDPHYVNYAEKIAKNIGGYFGKEQGVDEYGMSTGNVVNAQRKTEAERYARATFQKAYTKLKAEMGGIPSEAQVADLMYKVEGKVVSFLTEHYGSQPEDTHSNNASNFINGGNTPTQSSPPPSQKRVLSPNVSQYLKEIIDPQVYQSLMGVGMSPEEMRTFLESAYPDKLDEYDKLIGE